MARPPEVAKAAVSRLLQRLYPFQEVEEASIKQLPSFEDRNYYFRALIIEETPSRRRQEYVLKIFSTCSSLELVQGLSAAMDHVHARGLHCSQPVAARCGHAVKLLTTTQLLEGGFAVCSSGRRGMFCVLVLTYIPGEMLKSVEMTPRLACEVGEYIGKMDAAFQSFSHPEIDKRQFGDLSWDLREFLQISNHLPSIKDSAKRSMVESVLKSFEEHIQPHLALLAQGVIHADANSNNIILSKDDKGSYHVHGMIDFSDCHRGCYVFELAILLACFSESPDKDPITEAVPVIAGYTKAFPLPELDLKCLYPAVLARVCQVAVLTEVCAAPNNPYTAEILVEYWRGLEGLMKRSKSEADRLWRTAAVEDLMNADAIPLPFTRKTDS